MFSKWSMKAAIVTVVLSGWVIGAGCGSRNTPSTEEATSLGISDSEIGCLSHGGETYNRYLQGQAQDEDLIQYKNCALKALNVFAKRTKGAQSDRYSARELAAFLERYFLENTHLTDRFLEQAFRIKQIFIGGGTDSITRPELERIISLLGLMTDQLVILRPYMPWDLDRFIELPEPKFHELRNILVRVGLNVGNFLKESGQNWKFAEIPNFLRSFQDLGPWVSGEVIAEEIGANLSLIERLKVICLGPNPEGVKSDEWPRFTTSLISWYNLWLRILYETKRDPVFAQFDRYEITPAWLGTLTEGLDLLNRSISLQQNARIPLSMIVSTIDDLNAGFKSGASLGPLAEALWKLKVQFVGGSSDALSVGDLEAFKKWAFFGSSFFPKLKKIRPFEFENGYDALSLADFKEVTGQIKTLGAELGSFFKNVPGSVLAVDLVDMVKLWGTYFQLPLIRKIQYFELNFDLYSHIKGLFIGGAPDRIRKGEWEYTLVRATEWYSLYLKSLFWQKHDPIGNGFNQYQIDPEWVAIATEGLKYFEESAVNHESGTIRVEEVESLLKLLLNSQDFNTTKRFLSDALLLKRALVGGNHQLLIPTDFNRIKEFIEFSAKRFPDLKDVLPLSAEGVASLEFAELNRRVKKLVEICKDFGGFIQTYGTSYSWSEAIALLHSSSEYLAVDTQPIIDVIVKNLEVIRQTKFLIFASNKEGVSSSEWSEFLSVLSRTYGTYLKCWYFYSKKGSLDQGPGLIWGRQIIQDVVAELLLAVKRHRNQEILFESIDVLLKLLYPAGVEFGPKEVIKTKTLLAFYRAMTKSLLSGTDQSLNGRKARGLRGAHLHRLESSLLRVLDAQNFTEKLFKKAGRTQRDPQDDLKGIMKKRHLAESLLTHSIASVYGTPEPQISSAQLEAAKFVRWILRDGGRREFHRPLYQKDESQFIFPEGPWNYEISYYDLSQANWTNELVRLVINGYNSRDLDQAIAWRDLNLAEANHFYEDIMAISMELHVTDPSFKTVVSNRFIESNLFVYAANGDSFIDQAEATQLFGFLNSGKTQSNLTHAMIVKTCPKTGQVDVLTHPVVQAECYRRVFYSKIAEIFQNAPLMVKFIQSLKPDELAVFAKDFENACRKNPSSPMITSDDTDSFITIVQYVEALFVRIDKNHDSLLDWDEAKASYPSFKKILVTFAGTDNDAWLEPAFTYMLKYGHQPSKPQLIWWKGTSWSVKMDSDRGKIMGIIAEISSAQVTAKGQKKKLIVPEDMPDDLSQWSQRSQLK